MKKIFIMILLLILSSGCFNYKEINNLAIIPTIGIEKKDNNDYDYILNYEDGIDKYKLYGHININDNGYFNK